MYRVCARLVAILLLLAYAPIERALAAPEDGGVGAAVIPALFPQVPAIATYHTNTIADTIEMAGLTFHSSHSANLNGAKLDTERISSLGA